jgi:phosphotransferase system enzyme I (PtsP)
MLEVPSLVWQLDSLCRIADFVSVGSNDLQQFFFASDRGNTRLAGRYDPLSPALLRLLRHVAETCTRHEVSLSLCGEMAGKPLEAMALLGVGFRCISMQPAGIGPVKMMVRSLPLAKLERKLTELLEGNAHSLREPLQQFAESEGIAV